MAHRRQNNIHFDPEDVFYEWSGGRNITWRLVHGPTGISVEGSTQFTEATFSKKKLRSADFQLRAKLLHDLRELVIKHDRAAAGAK